MYGAGQQSYCKTLRVAGAPENKKKQLIVKVHLYLAHGG